MATCTPAVRVAAVPPWHARRYNSYASHFKENECFRQEIEPLLKKHNVDIMIFGHVHSYERTRPVYNFTVGARRRAPR